MDTGFGKRPLRYHSFILTLWFERGSDSVNPGRWRFSLQDPQTAVRLGFTELNEVVHYLEGWMAERPPNEHKEDAAY